jgi:hypothetical protein
VRYASFFVFCALLSGVARAGTTLEWRADATAGGVADDNWLFDEQRLESVGADAKLDGHVTFAAPRFSMSFDANVLQREFESEDLPDAQEFGVSANVARETLLGVHRLVVGYRTRDTLLSVVESDGLAATNEEERTTFASVISSRELGPRTRATFSLSANRVRYEAPTAERNDFDFQSLGVSLDYDLTPSLVGSVSLLADGYETEESTFFVFGLPLGTQRETALSVGPGVGLTYEAAERYQIAVELSARRRWNTTDVEFTVPGLPFEDQSIDEDEPEYLGEIRLARSFERGEVRLSASRDVVPSSLGRLRTRDSVTLYASRQLSALSSVALAMSLLFDEEETSLALSDRVVLEDRESLNTELSFSRRVTENVAVTALYRFRTESSKGVDRFTGNGIFLTATYEMGNER